MVALSLIWSIKSQWTQSVRARTLEKRHGERGTQGPGSVVEQGKKLRRYARAPRAVVPALITGPTSPAAAPFIAYDDDLGATICYLPSRGRATRPAGRQSASRHKMRRILSNHHHARTRCVTESAFLLPFQVT